MRDDGFSLLECAHGDEVRTIRRPTAGGFETAYIYIGGMHVTGRVIVFKTDSGLCFWDVTAGEEVAFVPGPFGKVNRVDRTGAIWTITATGLLRWPVAQPDHLFTSGSVRRNGSRQTVQICGTVWT